MATSPVRAKEGSAQILIVEDDGIIARDIQMMLEELGYSVAGIAATGAEALAIAEREQLDLVLMDVNIKGQIDGIQTAARLVQQRGLPIVYLTAHTDDDTLARARDTEPFGYVAKPITVADVKVAVAVALTRYRSQRQIEEREEWLHSILQSTVEAMVITDSSGRIAFLNRVAEEITGNSSEDAHGRPFDDVVQLLDSAGDPQPVIPHPSQKEDSIVENTLTGVIIRPDMTQRQILATVAPMRQQSQTGMVVVMHDISALWTRQQELQDTVAELGHSNEKLTYLSYALSHDLKEPLRNISLHADLLRRQEDGTLSQEAKEQLQGIRDASRRMGAVMSSLLDYFSVATLDSEQAILVDANLPFREAIQNLKVPIEASGARVEAPELPEVYAHPTALMLVFQNLIGNAIKYADRESPLIRITSTLEGDFWRFTVEDNGQGFDPQHAGRIFELFKRAHGKDHPGYGIGLATCQRLVELHSGVIWAESKPGQGPRFHFTLPAKAITVAGASLN